MEKIKYRNIGGNDLAVDFYCSCPSPQFKDTPIADLMKKKIYLSGYSDNYFFEEVNKEPREFTCECGKKYSQQWKNDGYVYLKKIKK